MTRRSTKIWQKEDTNLGRRKILYKLNCNNIYSMMILVIVLILKFPYFSCVGRTNVAENVCIFLFIVLQTAFCLEERYSCTVWSDKTLFFFLLFLTNVYPSPMEEYIFSYSIYKFFFRGYRSPFGRYRIKETFWRIRVSFWKIQDTWGLLKDAGVLLEDNDRGYAGVLLADTGVLLEDTRVL